MRASFMPPSITAAAAACTWPPGERLALPLSKWISTSAAASGAPSGPAAGSVRAGAAAAGGGSAGGGGGREPRQGGVALGGPGGELGDARGDLRQVARGLRVGGGRRGGIGDE